MNMAQRLNAIRQRIKQAVVQAKRQEQEITLIAVSKTQPLSAIKEALFLGVNHFGENYAQELVDKAESLAQDKEVQDYLRAQQKKIHFHFIGALQTNKINKLKSYVSTWHTVDSFLLATHLNKRLTERASIFVQINIDEEPQKNGVLPHRLLAEVRPILELSQLDLKGFMIIPEPHQKHPIHAFERTHTLLQQFNQTCQVSLACLSMGMSDDFELAILAGATHVRLGRVLFGERT